MCGSYKTYRSSPAVTRYRPATRRQQLPVRQVMGHNICMAMTKSCLHCMQHAPRRQGRQHKPTGVPSRDVPVMPVSSHQATWLFPLFCPIFFRLPFTS